MGEQMGGAVGDMESVMEWVGLQCLGEWLKGVEGGLEEVAEILELRWWFEEMESKRMRVMMGRGEMVGVGEWEGE
jgi:hypothetical protein